MSEPEPDDRPATRSDLINAVCVIVIAMMLCSNVDSCGRRLQIEKLRKDLEQQGQTTK